MDEVCKKDTEVSNWSVRDEIDFSAEHCGYHDEGCELAGSCLHCPFLRCVREENRGRRRWLKQMRACEISRLNISGGKGVPELATMFGISSRTVYRALKRVRDSKLSFSSLMRKPEAFVSREKAENHSPSK
jgi:hypothetical protein